MQVELCSESNLFFLYIHDLNEQSYKEVQVRADLAPLGPTAMHYYHLYFFL